MNAQSDRVATGFSFESDWLREWHEISRPIKLRRKVKPRGKPGLLSTPNQKMLYRATDLLAEVTFS